VIEHREIDRGLPELLSGCGSLGDLTVGKMSVHLRAYDYSSANLWGAFIRLRPVTSEFSRAQRTLGRPRRALPGLSLPRLEEHTRAADRVKGLSASHSGMVLSSSRGGPAIVHSAACPPARRWPNAGITNLQVGAGNRIVAPHRLAEAARHDEIDELEGYQFGLKGAFYSDPRHDQQVSLGRSACPEAENELRRRPDAREEWRHFTSQAIGRHDVVGQSHRPLPSGGVVGKGDRGGALSDARELVGPVVSVGDGGWLFCVAVQAVPARVTVGSGWVRRQPPSTGSTGPARPSAQMCRAAGTRCRTRRPGP